MVCRTSDDLGHIHGTLTILILDDQPERTAPLTRVSERPQQIVKEPPVNIDSAAAKGRNLSGAAAGSSLSLSSAPPMAGDAWRSWADNIAAGYAIA